MEELQIQTFVHRISTDSELRDELRREPESVIMRGGFSSRVSRVIERLVPHLTLEQEPMGKSFCWWTHCQ